MKRYLLAIATAGCMAFSSAAAETSVEFDLNFKDATVSYVESGVTKEVAATALPTTPTVMQSVVIKLGQLTMTLYNNNTSSSKPGGDVVLSYSSDKEAIVVNYSYKEDMGSYQMTQNIYNVFWHITPPGTADNSSFMTFTLTASDGSQPLPLPQYMSSSKANGGFSWVNSSTRTASVWKRYNNNPVYEVVFPNMGQNQDSYPSKIDGFVLKNIKGTYVTTAPAGKTECKNFAEVRALADGTEFIYTGSAAVTWAYGDELWLRDGDGAGMCFTNATNLPSGNLNGYEITSNFEAVYNKYWRMTTTQEKHEERDVCTFATMPTFTTSSHGVQYPELVGQSDIEAFPQDNYSSLVRVFPQKFDGKYVSLSGTFFYDYNDFDIPLRAASINVGTAEAPECIILNFTGIKSPHYNPWGIDGTDYNWFAGDAAPTNTVMNNLIGKNIRVQGMVMRNTGVDSSGEYYDSKGGELLVTHMQSADNVITGIETPEIDTSVNDGTVEYYDLSGRRVAVPGRGFYIIRSGGKAAKVFVK